jgi:hypothetical protein
MSSSTTTATIHPQNSILYTNMDKDKAKDMDKDMDTPLLTLTGRYEKHVEKRETKNMKYFHKLVKYFTEKKHYCITSKTHNEYTLEYMNPTYNTNDTIVIGYYKYVNSYGFIQTKYYIIIMTTPMSKYNKMCETLKTRYFEKIYSCDYDRDQYDGYYIPYNKQGSHCSYVSYTMKYIYKTIVNETDFIGCFELSEILRY